MYSIQGGRARPHSDTRVGQRPSALLELSAAVHCCRSSVITSAADGAAPRGRWLSVRPEVGKAVMSKGSDPKNAPASSPSGQAAPNPFAGMLDQFGQSWTTSLGILSAWSDTWQSMLRARGGPAAEAMLQTLFNPTA